MPLLKYPPTCRSCTANSQTSFYAQKSSALPKTLPNMWWPPAMPQPDSYAAGITWQLIPFHSLYHGDRGLSKYPYLSINVAKKFMLCRSLFDLVNSSYSLELEDERLLAWYSSLSDEDRKIIQDEGGFHQFIRKHPALDIAQHIGIVHVKPQIRRAAITMSSELNKSRMPTFYGMSQCKKCGTSCRSGSEVCRTCFVPQPVVDESTYLTGQKQEPAAKQSNPKEEQNMPSRNGLGVWGVNSHGAPGDHQVAQDSFQSAFDDSHTSLTSSGPRGGECPQAPRFSKEWREGRSSVQNVTASAFKDTSAQASFSLDVELERHSKMTQGSAPPAYPVHQDPFGRVTDNRSYLDLAQEMPPEYYSFNSTMFDQTSANLMENTSLSAEKDDVDSFMATRGSTECTESGLTTSSAGLCLSDVSVSCHSCPSEWTNLDATADENLRNNKPRDEFHSIMEESVNSEPWLNCSVTPEKPHAPPFQKPYVDLPVKLDIEKSPQTPSRDEQSMAESFMSISPDKSGVLLPVSAAPATVNQMVDASGDFRACFTSTQECVAAPSTTDASTEMDSPMCFDQDTQTSQASTEMDSPMCFDQDTQTSQASTADKSVITEVHLADLDYLTKEFLRLKSVEEKLEQLKASQLKSNNTKCGCECGQRLQQAELKLLALQYSMCQDHCWRRYYTSVQGESQLQCTGGVPESLAETLRALEQDYIQLKRQVLSGAALDELNPLSVDTQRLHIEAPYTPAQIAICKAAEAHPKPHSVKSSKVGSLKTQRKSGSSRPGGGEVSEAWYDAEEDLGAAGQTLKEDRLRKAIEMADVDGKNISSSCDVFITDLHQDVTEDDLLFLFEKYQPREVCFTMSNASRSGKVTVSSPENAAAAARELSGTSIHGQPVQVRRVSRLPAAGPEGEHTFKKPHAPSAPTPAPSGDVAKPGGVKTSTPYNMSPKPSRCHIEKLVNISDVPTATGTYVPQQPPTNAAAMGSFDTLMGRLSERHPLVARQKIVEALLKLRAQHRGSLSGLPLRTIVEMTSDLLTVKASVSP
ncbi:RNA-binding protein 44 isoform X3 [Alosa alosa]|uniref:RNA-binding protein 44 isoform X3 n=1 Tax=Alosa alosa TaxID=278164 RepID=UPI002015154E|nr:RNA-binding protein 44 isoform X3 [Alosa alosa]